MPRSKYPEGVKYAKYVLETEQEKAKQAFMPQGRSVACEMMEGRKEDWVGRDSDSSTFAREFSPTLGRAGPPDCSASVQGVAAGHLVWGAPWEAEFRDESHGGFRAAQQDTQSYTLHSRRAERHLFTTVAKIKLNGISLKTDLKIYLKIM